MAIRLLAEKALATYGLPRSVDPLASLVEEHHRTAGHVAWLGEVIRRLPVVGGAPEPEFGDDVHGDIEADDGDEEVEGEATSNHDGLLAWKRDTSGMLWRAPSVWLELYDRERKHLTAIGVQLVKLGYEQKRLAVVEQTAAVIVRALTGILAGLGIAQDDPRVPDLVRTHLSAIEATGTEL